MTAVYAIASLALIRWCGLAGAALTTCATLIIWKLAIAFYVWRPVQVLPSVLGMFRCSV
jgi:hypothetical protein